RHRELATPLQHDQAPRLNRIQATSTRGVRARIRRVAGCATPTGSAGHAGATANLKLTFHLDHSAGAGHSARRESSTESSPKNTVLLPSSLDVFCPIYRLYASSKGVAISPNKKKPRLPSE